MPEERWHARYGSWLDWTSLAGLLLLLVAALFPAFGMLAAVVFHFTAATLLWIIREHAPTPADRITQIRAIGVGLLYLFVLGGVDWRILLGLAAFFAALDLVDGWIARRSGATQFGAVFDMEMDQLMVTALAIIGMSQATMPPWLILFPGLRYLNLVALRLLRLPRLDPKPKDGDNARARLICALVVIVLLSNIIPGSTSPLRLLLNACALGLLMWSFADDFVFLYSRFRHRRPPA